jgi:hypothetical protein
MSGSIDWTFAEWDDTAVYDLTVAIVNTYLKELFGDYNFFTEVSLRPTCEESVLIDICRKLTAIRFGSGSQES